MAYRLVERPNGKLGKAPIDRRGWLVDCHDPAQWRSFNEVRQQGDGYGFVLDGTPFICLDIDGATVHPVVNALGSYTEYSPSANGLHCWLSVADKAPLPAVVGGVEVYGEGFITVTGKRAGLASIRRLMMAELLAALGADTQSAATLPPRPAIAVSAQPEERLYKRPASSLADSDLWQVIFENDCTNRVRAIALVGDVSVTGETRPASSRERVSPGFRKAVIVLANALAHYLPADGQRIEQMIRESALCNSPEARVFDQAWDRRQPMTWLAYMVADAMKWGRGR